MESLWSVSKFSTESVGSRRDCEFCSHRRRDATRQLSRFGVGGVGVYWAVVRCIVKCEPPVSNTCTFKSMGLCGVGDNDQGRLTAPQTFGLVRHTALIQPKFHYADFPVT